MRATLADAHFDRGRVNPFHSEPGEQLLRVLFRNYQRLLVQGATSFTLDQVSQSIVAQEIQFQADHVVIACLMQGDLLGQATKSWWTSLCALAAPSHVQFYGRTGPNFMYVCTDGRETTDRILTQAWHTFEGGAVLYQRWTKGFNPHLPLGLVWPLWISFHDLPLKYPKHARQVAEQVGSVFVESQEEALDKPPRFCVGVDIRRGRISNVVGISDSGGSASITLQYDKVDLQCSRCGSHQHPNHLCPRFRLPASAPAHRLAQRGPPPRPAAITPRRNKPPPSHPLPLAPPYPSSWANRPSPPRFGPRRHRHRAGRRRGGRRPSPSPDAEGFIPVLLRRRRAFLFDIHPPASHHIPSGAQSAPSDSAHPTLVQGVGPSILGPFQAPGTTELAGLVAPAALREPAQHGGPRIGSRPS